MGMIPPPAPLSPEEFKKRYKPGMTVLDIDPVFRKWDYSGIVGIFMRIKDGLSKKSHRELQ